ncbi:MAG: imidazoleglycerol-phosphate dehydratase, partial [Methanobrevibacter sp.]|nr:imidazoleglycerol-phosphate dehydratase [Methanobrevibacter sp.]
MTRISNVSRKTSETDITIKMDLDGSGKYDISTGVNFFNHMLESFSKHSMIDLDVIASGDIEIDDHHTIEDVGILLGEAFLQAIGDKRG